MRSRISTLFLILSLFVLSIPIYSHSHGGGHEEATPEKIETPGVDRPASIEEIISENTDSSFENSIYDEAPDTASDTGLGEYDLGEEEPDPISESSSMMDSMSSHDSHEGMDMGGDEHAGHDMEEVELANHEWVSNSRKGYSAAMGITILAGLVFGFLTLKRPFE
jgi:hypothetical protein